MASQTLNTIKNWFKTGLKPTQTQFWDTWDSFRHKYEKVPVKDVDGLDELLLSKAEKTVLDEHLADKNAHAPQVNTDWNSNSGFSQLLNKPEFKTINGKKIVGNGDIAIKEGGSQNLQETLNNGSSAGFDGTSNIKLLDGEPFQKVVSWDFLNDAQESHFLGNLETFSSSIKNGNRKTSIQQQSNELTFSKTQDTEDGTFQNTLDLGIPTSNSKFTLPSKEVDGNYTLATTDEIIGENGLTLQKVLENGSEGIISNGVKIGHNAADDSTWSTLNLKDGNGIDLYSSGAFYLRTKGFYLNSSTGGGLINAGDPIQNEPLRINSQSSGMEIGGGAGGLKIDGQGGAIQLSGEDYDDGGIIVKSRLGIGRVKNIGSENIEVMSTQQLRLNGATKTTLELNNGADTIIEMNKLNGKTEMNIRSMGTMDIIVPNDKLKVIVGTDEGTGMTVNNKNVVRSINAIEADVHGNVVLPISGSLPVSATQSGIIDNTPLQELGGVDKLINGIRIGQGEGTGSSNTILGINGLSSNTTGSKNTGVGFGVLQANTTGESNTGLGDSVFQANTTGSYNDAFGSNALSNNTTGIANTAIGGYALAENQTSQYNVAIGCNSLSTMISGSGQSTAIGAFCMSEATSTDKNAAIGTFALRYNTSGFSNTAIGHTALGLNTSGNSNNAIGNYSLGAVTTGAANIGVGKFAGKYITSGIGNIYIGSEGSANDAEANGIINIGNRFIAKESKISLIGTLNIGTTPVYENNTTAINAGLVAGDIFRTSTGILMIAY